MKHYDVFSQNGKIQFRAHGYLENVFFASDCGRLSTITLKRLSPSGDVLTFTVNAQDANIKKIYGFLNARYKGVT